MMTTMWCTVQVDSFRHEVVTYTQAFHRAASTARRPTTPRASPPIAFLPAAPSVAVSAGCDVADGSSAPSAVVSRVVVSDMVDSLVVAEESVEMVVEVVIGGPLIDAVLVPMMVDNGTPLEDVVVSSEAVVEAAPMVLTTFWNRAMLAMIV